MPDLTVYQVVFRHDDLFELQLERGDILFEPGACLALFNDRGDSRPYSIAAGTDGQLLRFLVRRLPDGRVSDWLARRAPGDKVQTSAPFGWFRPGGATGDEACVFIATGTGIAPFLSYLRSNKGRAPEAVLYGVRHQIDAFALEELQQLQRFRLAVSRDAGSPHFQGRVTALLDQVPLDRHIHYYLCGLDTMIDNCSLWLESQGITYTHIHQETFFYEEESL